MRGSEKGVTILKACVLLAALALAFGAAQSAVAETSQSLIRLETPVKNAKVFGIVQVKGFVLDERAVSNITLLVDGVAVHEADLNQPRPDLQKRYPNFFGGNPFPYDPGFSTSFLAANYPDGEHTIAIEVTFAATTLPGEGPESGIFEERTVVVDNLINQPPIGGLDSPRDFFDPREEDIISGVYPITGWALDDQAIRTTVAPDGKIRADIDIMFDRRVVGQVVWGLARPDVANAHPDVPDSLHSGWLMNLDTTSITNGRHLLSVRAWDTLGKSRIIGTRSVWVDNHYATLRPFGKIDWPMSNGHFYSTQCYVPGGFPSGFGEYDPVMHTDWVAGWVVDQNDQVAFEGVVYVELLFNGVLIYNTVEDCAMFPMSPTTNVLANCYGVERPDILYYYPQFDWDAKYAGFFFAFKTEYFLGVGILHRGLNIVSVRVGTRDPQRPAVIIDQIPVIVSCNELCDEPSFGDLELPRPMADLKGSVFLEGWIVDMNGGVRELRVYVDGILDGRLTFPNPNIWMDRSDVLRKYPWLQGVVSTNLGFRYTLDTAKYVDGQHQIVIESEDFSGYHNYWVQRPLVFNNIP